MSVLSMFRRLRGSVRTSAFEQDMEAELRHHLDLETDALVARGMTPEAARDAEEVRELLTRYFDTCRRLVSLYGGTVEKFIGDAVMAVWGTPVAQEDDAERNRRARAVIRTAVELEASVRTDRFSAYPEDGLVLIASSGRAGCRAVARA